MIDSNTINANGCCDDPEPCPDCGRAMKYHAWAAKPFYECKWCGTTTESILDCAENLKELAEEGNE